MMWFAPENCYQMRHLISYRLDGCLEIWNLINNFMTYIIIILQMMRIRIESLVEIENTHKYNNNKSFTNLW